MKKYQRGAGAGPALATAARAVPAAAITPASACASAVHCALLGFRNRSVLHFLFCFVYYDNKEYFKNIFDTSISKTNIYCGACVCSLDPERKKESIEKYLGPPQPWEQN